LTFDFREAVLVCLPLISGVFMNEFILPELYCPFPSQINKSADVLEEYSMEWLRRFNLLPNESIYQRFRKSKFFLLAAGAYPNCQLEELKIGNDWLSWVFIWDDQCDLSELKKQPELLKSHHKRFLEILNGSEPTNKDILHCYALRDLRQRTLEISSLQSFHHLVCCFEDYFHGCVQEAICRVQGIVPDLDTYLKIRRSSVGVNLFITVSELCNQLMIPDFLRKHDIVIKLKLMTVNIITWCNDIYSLSREKANFDVHNLILVLHHHQDMSIEQALQMTANMHDQDIRTMMSLEKSFPLFGSEVDAELAKYISIMHAWIRGNLDWSSSSARYQNRENLELESLKLKNLELLKY
jgi:5-epi-alpha-selinene synthase